MSQRMVPLVVGLNGTLIKSDSLVEGLITTILRSPAAVIPLLVALFKGRSALKAQLVRLGAGRPETLPIREDLLDYLRAEKSRGRQLHLATASDQALAESVADRVGIFDSVEGSRDGVNLKGRHKLERLRERFPDGFAYAGRYRSDLLIWRNAAAVVLVGATDMTRRAALRLGRPIEGEFPRQKAGIGQWLRAVRLHQWSKNLLLAVPLLLAHKYNDAAAVQTMLLGLLSMCLVASGTYLINDLSDLDADRAHDTKSSRPIARGDIGPGTALLAALVLIGAGLLGGSWIGAAFFGLLVLYIAMTMSYSLYFKSVAMFDVFMLGSLYTLRIFMGMVLLELAPAPWLLVFCLFFFFSLSMAKRHGEIARFSRKDPAPGEFIKGRGYKVSDAPLVLAFGVSANLAAILILFLYIVNDAYPADSYANPAWLWLIGFLVFLWTSRVWLLSHRGELNDDPVAFAVRDPLSWLLGGIVLGVFALAVL